MVEIGDILVLVCASGRAVRLSGPILKSWQNPRDELQNNELYQSPAKALHEALCEALQKLYQKLYQRLCNTSTHPVY
jgi:hypothetical protein